MLTLKHDKSGHIRKEYSRFFPDRLSHAIFLTAFNNPYTIFPPPPCRLQCP